MERSIWEEDIRIHLKELNQIIKCLNQIISENKPYNLRLCTFTLHKFQEKKSEPEPGFELGPPDL